MRLAYLSQGKLYVKDGEKDFRLIDSQFGQEIVNRALQEYQRNDWKRSKGESNLVSGSRLWNVQEQDPRALRVHITGVTLGREEGELLYALETDQVGGFFLYDFRSNSERRLFHKERFRTSDLQRHPELPLIASAIHFPNGTSNLVVVEQERPIFDEVTTGDSRDEAPSWVPGPRKQLVFQSSGIGRNPQGFTMGFSPSTIEKLDLETGTLETMAQDPKQDHLLPRMDAEGNLYFIRRPYDLQRGGAYSFWQGLKDTLFFPFRFLRALFHYLNFMSFIYSNKTLTSKPLTPPGTPGAETPDLKTILLRGRAIDVKKAMMESGSETKDVPALVPGSWQLVRKDREGSEKVLARSVVAYDLIPEGGVVYTNGSGIFLISPDASEIRLAKAKLVENLVVLR